MMLSILLLLATGSLGHVTVGATETVQARPGQRVEATLALHIADGIHLQAPPAPNAFLIPLELRSHEGSSIRIVDVRYPEGREGELAVEGQVYDGAIELVATLEIPIGIPAGSNAARGVLVYQACSRSRCYAPREVEVLWSVETGDLELAAQ